MKPIKKIKHKDRKHFMVRDHGHYGWGEDENISGNTKYKRWQSSMYGQKSGGYGRGWRSRRELLNSAERNDIDDDVDYN